MVSSRSPGASVTCNNNSTAADISNKNELIVNSTSREESDYNLRNDNQPERNLNDRLRWNSESGPPSLSMSIDLNHATAAQHDSGSFSASPDPNNATKFGDKVTVNHEEEERYEAFGAVEGDCDEESPGGSSSAPSPTGPASLRNPRSPSRHSWLRTSLRRTPSGTSRKRLSSNALASQLYRSSSFNSSGRGSICDTAEDMYSDVSLEDDVLDLNHRNPNLIPIGAETRSTRKRDASHNCPSEFVCCNNHKGIIEPKHEEVLNISPKKSISPATFTDSEQKEEIKNKSIETASNKSHKSEGSSSHENKKSSGTHMTDDEKLALRKSS